MNGLTAHGRGTLRPSFGLLLVALCVAGGGLHWLTLPAESPTGTDAPTARSAAPAPFEAVPPPEQVAKAIAPMEIKNHVIQIVDFAATKQAAASTEVFQNVARITGGQFFQVSDADGLRNVYQQIDQLEKSAFKENRQKTYHELMGWFAWPAALILLVELMLTHWVWRRLP